MGWSYRAERLSARLGWLAGDLVLSVIVLSLALLHSAVAVSAAAPALAAPALATPAPRAFVALASSTSARPVITRPKASGTDDGGDPLSERQERIATAVAAQGYYTEVGAGVDEVSLGRMQRRLVSAGDEIGVVMLAQAEPQPRTFANDILDLVRGKASKLTTIVVITPTDLAGSSRRFTNLDEGLAAALPVFEKDIVGGFVELHLALTGGPLPVGGKEPSKPSSVPWPAIFGAGAVLLALSAVILAVRSGRVRPPSAGAV